MPLFARWRAERELQRKAAAFVAALFRRAGRGRRRWLAGAATRGDPDHARWELRYARRALGLIAAQRDALDDRTASIVAREIAEAFARDQQHRGRRWRDRRAAVQRAAERVSRRPRARKAGAPTRCGWGRRCSRSPAAASRARTTNIVRAGELLGEYLAEANEALRASFGTAALPENVPPSRDGERRKAEPLHVRNSRYDRCIR